MEVVTYRVYCRGKANDAFHKQNGEAPPAQQCARYGPSRGLVCASARRAPYFAARAGCLLQPRTPDAPRPCCPFLIGVICPLYNAALPSAPPLLLFLSLPLAFCPSPSLASSPQPSLLAVAFSRSLFSLSPPLSRVAVAFSPSSRHHLDSRSPHGFLALLRALSGRAPCTRKVLCPGRFPRFHA